jgi:hypothetical protein
LSLLLGWTVAMADLAWKDYEASETVWSVTTIRVAPNMDDAYLEGLKKTWVATNEISRNSDRSRTTRSHRATCQQSSDFNLLLVVEFANTSDLAPNKARYEAFMKNSARKSRMRRDAILAEELSGHA